MPVGKPGTTLTLVLSMSTSARKSSPAVMLTTACKAYCGLEPCEVKVTVSSSVWPMVAVIGTSTLATNSRLLPAEIGPVFNGHEEVSDQPCKLWVAMFQLSNCCPVLSSRKVSNLLVPGWSVRSCGATSAAA